MHPDYIALGVDQAGSNLLFAPIRKGRPFHTISIMLDNVEVQGAAAFSDLIGRMLLTALGSFEHQVCRYPLMPTALGPTRFPLESPHPSGRAMQTLHMGLDIRLDTGADEAEPALLLQAHAGLEPVGPAAVESLAQLSTLERACATAIVGLGMLRRLAALHPGLPALAALQLALDAIPPPSRAARPHPTQKPAWLEPSWTFPREPLEVRYISLGISDNGAVLMGANRGETLQCGIAPIMLADLATQGKVDGAIAIGEELFIRLRVFRSEMSAVTTLHALPGATPLPQCLPTEAARQARPRHMGLGLRDEPHGITLLLQAYEGDQTLGQPEALSLARLEAMQRSAAMYLIGDGMLRKLAALHRDVPALQQY